MVWEGGKAKRENVLLLGDGSRGKGEIMNYVG